MEELHNNTNLVVCSLNCEGVRRSIDYIKHFLDTNNCDVLCLQETWTIDSNFFFLSNNHNDYLFTYIAGIDHTIGIIKGRPHGALLLCKEISKQRGHSY